MSDVIQFSDYQTGARFFRPRITAASRHTREAAPAQDNALRQQAPSRIRHGDTVRAADGSKGFVLRETPEGKVVVSVNGISRTVDPALLQKAGA